MERLACLADSPVANSLCHPKPVRPVRNGHQVGLESGVGITYKNEVAEPRDVFITPLLPILFPFSKARRAIVQGS